MDSAGKEHALTSKNLKILYEKGTYNLKRI
jgi:hypothetical protein